MDENSHDNEDDLDAFFKAADTNRPGAIRLAARNVGKSVPEPPPPSPSAFEADEEADSSLDDSDSATSIIRQLQHAVEETNEHAFVVDDDDEEEDEETDDPAPPINTLPVDLAGKFIAIAPAASGHASDSDQPFILIPAGIHHLVPWWGWLTIILGLLMLVAGVVLMPAINLDRLVSRLDDKNEANVRHAMRQIVIKGDERTVKKLYGVATSSKQGITARLRAVDAMSLIERVPEVDRALLRLELAAETNQRVRDAAIAARKQREAYKTRGGTRP